MSLARAFTKRIKRDDATSFLSRGGTVKHSAGIIDRSMISLPTELISTTNVQALTAPNLPGARSISGASSKDSLSSGNDSDFSTIDRGFLNGADDSSTDLSSPSTPITPPMDHKDFFDVKPVPAPALLTAAPVESTPAVPKRAPSHSKKAHVELSRKRSVQRLTPPPTNLEQSLVRNSADMFSPKVEESHPFGRELAKVNEVAEGFGIAASVIDEEEQELLNKGLCKFSVDDYINEIAGIYGGGIFENKLANPWL